METATGIVLPDFLPYLLAVVGLLVLWQYHQIQVMKGRIRAIDIFDRSGVRMYLYIVADDPQTCDVCHSAHGVVFPPSEVITRKFSPIKGRCKNPAGCIGFLVGLYGAWTEAQQIVERLQLSRKSKPIRLDQDELNELIFGPWERSISANTDRIGIHVLEAVLGDRTSPNTAMVKYNDTLESAQEIRHRPLIVPVYLRLIELLTREGNTTEALRIIKQFETRYEGKLSEPYAPTVKQLALMSIMKSRLKHTARTTTQAPTTSAA